MNTTPTPLMISSRARIILALIHNLADDQLETVTLDVELATWLISSLNQELLDTLAFHLLGGHND